MAPEFQGKVNEAIAKEDARNRDRRKAAYLESNPVDAVPEAMEIKEVGKGASLRIHSVRKRLTDADGVSHKAFIDGLIEAGVLQDDGPQHIKEVTFTQEKGYNERIIATLTWEE